MRNHDVEELFELVAIGDAVELYGERTPELDGIFAPAQTIRDGMPAGQ
jgi:hypothetical protein